MKKNYELRYAIHLALVELDNAQIELMKLVCMRKDLCSKEWRSALHKHAKMYSRLQKILSETNIENIPPIKKIENLNTFSPS